MIPDSRMNVSNSQEFTVLNERRKSVYIKNLNDALKGDSPWTYLEVVEMFLKDINYKGEKVDSFYSSKIDFESTIESGEFKGLTLLDLAASKGFYNVANFLINECSDVTLLNIGNSVYYAASEGHTEIVRLLIKNGVNCETPLKMGEDEGNTPICVASLKGHVDIIKLLIENGVNCQACIQCGECEGLTPIYLALHSGEIDVVKLLIANGVNCNLPIQTGKCIGRSLINLAAFKGNIDMVNLLIENGADFKQPLLLGDMKGETPILAAASNGKTDMVKFLIEKGVDYKSPLLSGKSEGLTPLYAAALNGHVQTVKLLMCNGADYKQANQSGKQLGLTPIYVAASRGFTDVVKLLIDNGADFNSALQEGAWKGLTPIYSAVLNGQTEVVKLLIECGADCRQTIMSGPEKDLTLISLAAFKGHAEVVKLLIKNDVFFPYLVSMPPQIAEIYQSEQKRDIFILELFSKGNLDKQFQFKFVMVDSVLYLSIKPRSSVFFDHGLHILQSKGIKIEQSKTKGEIWIRKSQSSLLLKLMDDWKNACYLIEMLLNSGLFEKRIIEQCNFDENALVLHLKPFEKVIFRRIILKLNGIAKFDEHFLVPFELLNRKDINFKELKRTANLNTEKMNRVINLTKIHGKAKLVYTDSALLITFKDEQFLNNFVRAFPISKLTEKQFEVSCLYDDILDSELLPTIKPIEPTNATNEEDICIASFQKALEPLISNYKIWQRVSDTLEAELKPQFLAILTLLNIPGLELNQKLRIKIEEIVQLSHDKLIQIGNDVKENHNKIINFERILRKVSIKDTRTNNDQGYVFCFKDEKHKTCFEIQLQNMLEPTDDENQFVIKYSKILELDQEQLNMLLKKVEELKPVVQVVRPAQPIQIVNNINAMAVPAVAKKSQKKKKKNHGNQAPSSESKPSAVAKAIDSYKGPKIAPQPHQRGLMPRVEREFCVWSHATLEIDYTTKPIKPVPVVVLMNKKVLLNDYEACIKHELEFLKGLSKWYEELEINSKSQFSEIYCDSLWLGLLRFYNAVFLRAKNTKNIVSLSENDMDARKIRACLIHFFRDKKSLESHYQRYILKSMGPIVDNDFKIPEGCNRENLSNCLLLQDCKAIADFTPIVKEQFQLIVEYLKILKIKAEKQIKALSGVFQCAVEGDMADSDFRFLVHEAKAIEACLVKLGELHRHVKDSSGIADEVKRFIAKCRKLRNRITHEVGENYPVTAEIISKLAEEAKSLCEKHY